MSVDALRTALEELAEPTACEGTVAVHERLAVMLPDGDVAAVDDPGFVDWLVEHGEPAPFGFDRETRVDPAVRDAVRLKVRGAARISGFEVSDVLGQIEQALSPERHLEATLTDVLVYPPGGHLLQRPLLDVEVGALLECVSFEPPWGDDGGGYELDEVESLQDRVLDDVPRENWVLRRTAAATLLRAIEFVDNGWIGNGGCEAWLYKLAAIEVTRGE